MLSVGFSVNNTVLDNEVENNELTWLCGSSCISSVHSNKIGGLTFLRFFPTKGSFFLSVGVGKQPNLNQEVHLGNDSDIYLYPTFTTATSATDIIYKRRNVSYGIFTIGWIGR